MTTISTDTTTIPGYILLSAPLIVPPNRATILAVFDSEGNVLGSDVVNYMNDMSYMNFILDKGPGTAIIKYNSRGIFSMNIFYITIDDMKANATSWSDLPQLYSTIYKVQTPTETKATLTYTALLGYYGSPNKQIDINGDISAQLQFDSAGQTELFEHYLHKGAMVKSAKSLYPYPLKPGAIDGSIFVDTITDEPGSGVDIVPPSTDTGGGTSGGLNGFTAFGWNVIGQGEVANGLQKLHVPVIGGNLGQSFPADSQGNYNLSDIGSTWGAIGTVRIFKFDSKTPFTIKLKGYMVDGTGYAQFWILKDYTAWGNYSNMFVASNFARRGFLTSAEATQTTLSLTPDSDKYSLEIVDGSGISTSGITIPAGTWYLCVSSDGDVFSDPNKFLPSWGGTHSPDEYWVDLTVSGYVSNGGATGVYENLTASSSGASNQSTPATTLPVADPVISNNLLTPFDTPNFYVVQVPFIQTINTAASGTWLKHKLSATNAIRVYAINTLFTDKTYVIRYVSDAPNVTGSGNYLWYSTGPNLTNSSSSPTLPDSSKALLEVTSASNTWYQDTVSVAADGTISVTREIDISNPNFGGPSLFTMTIPARDYLYICVAWGSDETNIENWRAGTAPWSVPTNVSGSNVFSISVM